MAQRNQVFRIEGKSCLKLCLGIGQPSHFVHRLSEQDVSAHVPGLLREVLLADEQRLVQIPSFTVFVREGRKVSTRILVEFLFQFVDSGRNGHVAPSCADTRRGSEAQDRTKGGLYIALTERVNQKSHHHLILARSGT